MKKKIKVGIIGCGTIGGEIAKACESSLKGAMELVGICDIDETKAQSLRRSIKGRARVLKLDELIAEADLIVEAASAAISGEILKKCVRRRKDILVMSVGGLLKESRILEQAAKLKIRVYIPSGALCGVDGLKSASVGKIESVTLTTRKPPKGLEGAPYVKEKGIRLSDISEETVIFEGSAVDAVRGFPQNVNVCAVLSLAGIGPLRTRVRIVTAPDYTKNIHEVEIKGDFGTLTTRSENVPSKANPRTSALAILSAIATLEGIAGSVRIGT